MLAAAEFIVSRARQKIVAIRAPKAREEIPNGRSQRES